jgi:cytochrome b pre-mRNA-processing protein 3
LKQTTEPYIAYGTTSTLLAECSKQINYTIPSALANPKQPAPQNSAGENVGEGAGWWYTPKSQGGLGLEVTFASWAQVMFMYMYCLTVRLRAFPEKHARIWHQQLLDHFFYAAEDRMAVWHNIATRGVRNKYLKDLSQMWRGVLLSYDEGVIKGDAVLAGAVWRNVFKGDENADIEDMALVTAFLRGQLKMLDGLSDVEIGEGRVKFQDPAKFRVLVNRESAMMKKGFSNEEMGAKQARAE